MKESLWTQERENALSTMWTWGIGSGEIARMLGGFTRNAIMGKINRMNLMGHKGTKIGCYYPGDLEYDEAIPETAGELLGREYDPHGNEDQYASVVLAAIYYGRYFKPIEKVTGISREKILKILDDLDTTGVWKDGDPPPSAWWHHKEGNITFVLDLLVAIGEIKTFMKEGEKYYFTENTKSMCLEPA